MLERWVFIHHSHGPRTHAQAAVAILVCSASEPREAQARFRSQRTCHVITSNQSQKRKRAIVHF